MTKEELEGTTTTGPPKSGGPHGLGDPNDTSLRVVEKNVLIPKIIRDRSRLEKCGEEYAAFGKCAKESGLLVAFKCREENNIMKACLEKWWTNEEFKEECKQQYLRERAEYRLTGLNKLQRKAAEEKTT